MVPGVLAVPHTAETLKTVTSPDADASPATCKWCLPTVKVLFRTMSSPSWSRRSLCADDGINKVLVEYETAAAGQRSVQGVADARAVARISLARPRARTVRASPQPHFRVDRPATRI